MKKILFSAMLFLTSSSYAGILMQPPPLNHAVKPAPTVKIDGVVQLNGLNSVVKDKTALVQLGKALFWDTAVSSDGTACASCHFSAGADSRAVNQINPGYNHNNRIYDRLPGGTVGPNQRLKTNDFPLWKVTGVDNNDQRRFTATVVDDVIGSSGALGGLFVNLIPNSNRENCTSQVLDEANVSGLNARLVTARNSPSAINATFNVRNFWDGRANKVFNGVNPFGLRDPTAKVWYNDTNGSRPVSIEIDNSSLASQAVGPVLNDVEMQCSGRTFQTVGTKLLSQKILSTQTINATDSVLSPVRSKPTYSSLVRTAFRENFWLGTNDSNIPLEEANFTLFFGLAVQAYEDTLVSDKSKYDLAPRTQQPIYLPGDPDPIAIGPQLVRTKTGAFAGLSLSESRGLDIFTGTVSNLNPARGVDPVTNAPIPDKDGKCMVCHNGPEFTSATFTALSVPKGVKILRPDAVLKQFLVELMPFNNGELVEIDGVSVFGANANIGMYDLGFYNIGVTPDQFDIGQGGTDPWGNPLSFAKQWENAFNTNSPCTVNSNVKNGTICNPPQTLDEFDVDTALVDENGQRLEVTPQLAPVRVNGAFKTPSLRNLTLTAPYFHNGSASTIEQTLIVYNNGGLFKNPALHPAVTPLELTSTDIQDLTNFMKTLTDMRVAREAAPFDHPSLLIPLGIKTDKNGRPLVTPGSTNAQDNFMSLPATGRSGKLPGSTFEQLLLK